MTVYVESNFVLEQALQQEQCEACDEILSLAVSGSLKLVIPAFSLAEPHQALELKERARNRMSGDLRSHILELGRSRQYRQIPNEFAPLTSMLARTTEQQRISLQKVTRTLLRSAEIVPLEADVLAATIDLQSTFVMSGQDAIVFASVLRHLRSKAPRESCFLSRNSKDFDDPDVSNQLDHFGCKYIARFDDGLRYILGRSPMSAYPPAT